MRYTGSEGADVWSTGAVKRKVRSEKSRSRTDALMSCRRIGSPAARESKCQLGRIKRGEWGGACEGNLGERERDAGKRD